MDRAPRLRTLFVCAILGIPRILASQSPSFEASRKTLFRIADFNGDGVLTDGGYMSQGIEIHEWKRIFDKCFELRLRYQSSETLRKLDWQDKTASKTSKKVWKRVREGRMEFKDFVVVSRKALLDIAESAGDAKGKQWAKAQSLLLLHEWGSAEAVFTQGFRSGALDVNVVAQTVTDMQSMGQFTEASVLRDLLTGLRIKSTELQDQARSLASNLPLKKGQVTLEPPPRNHVIDPYLQSIRTWPGADCPEVAATRDGVMKAMRAGKPAIIRGAKLVPGVADWASAFEGDGEHVDMVQVARDGVFFAVQASGRRETSNETTWNVRHADVPLRLGDLARVVPEMQAKNLRPAWIHRPILDMPRDIKDLVPKAPDIADGLNLTSIGLWAGFGGGTVSTVKFDGVNKIIAQVQGSKEFFLWKPLDMVHLGYVGRPQLKETFACCPAVLNYKRHPDLVTWDRGASNISQLFDQRQGLQKTTPLRCQTHPGDAVLVPEGWHQLVVSYPGAKEDCDMCGVLANLAVSFRFLSTQAMGVSDSAFCVAMAQRGDCAEHPDLLEATCKSACDFYRTKLSNGSKRVVGRTKNEF